MRRSVTLALALLALFLSYWWWPADAPDAGYEAAPSSLNRISTLNSGTIPIEAPPFTQQQASDSGTTKISAPAGSENKSNPEEDAVEPVEVDTPLRDQMRTVMQSYAEISRYPPYSQPIKSEAHIAAFINASLPEASFPFELSGGGTPIQLSLQLSAYQFFPGDRIEGEVRVSELPPGAAVSAQASLRDIAGRSLSDVGVVSMEGAGTARRFTLAINSADHSTGDWPQELVMSAAVDVNGEALFISVPLRFNPASAVITALGYSQPVAEFLQIPVRIDVVQAGYYHLAGILYNADASRPLIHLESEGLLSEGSAQLVLNAHIQALKSMQDDGPYVLSDLRLTRWADEQNPLDMAGKVEDELFIIQGYPFNSYEDKAYVDPLQAERQRLMEGLSQL